MIAPTRARPSSGPTTTPAIHALLDATIGAGVGVVLGLVVCSGAVLEPEEDARAVPVGHKPISQGYNLH